jgi:hypothetical protein
MSGTPAARLAYADHRTAFGGSGELAGVDLGCLYTDHRGLLLAVVEACRYPAGDRDSLP